MSVQYGVVLRTTDLSFGVWQRGGGAMLACMLLIHTGHECHQDHSTTLTLPPATPVFLCVGAHIFVFFLVLSTVR